MWNMVLDPSLDKNGNGPPSIDTSFVWMSTEIDTGRLQGRSSRIYRVWWSNLEEILYKLIGGWSFQLCERLTTMLR